MVLGTDKTACVELKTGTSGWPWVDASFAGPSEGAHAGAHFSIAHLEGTGRAFCEAVLDYCDPDQVECCKLKLVLNATAFSA